MIMPRQTSATGPRKAVHTGAPQCFQLELACRHLADAFGGYGCYTVGSVLEASNWRDVDVRFILPDDEFAKLFPQAGQCWEHDARWLLLTVSLSLWLQEQTGLPVDFQFQPQTHANLRHNKPRNAVGLRISSGVGCTPDEEYDEALPDLH